MLNKRILIIDDSQTVTMQLSAFLEKNGFSVDVANDVEEGLKKFSQAFYDVISIDLLIPEEKDGLDLLKTLKNKIKSDSIDTLVMVISAMPKKQKEKVCIDAGADYYVEKNENCNEEILNIINKRVSL